MKHDLEKKIEFVKEKVYIANEAKTEEDVNFFKTKEGFAYSYNINLERLFIALNKIHEDYVYSNGNIILLDCIRDEENNYHNEIVCKYDLTNEQTISKLAEIFGYSEKAEEKKQIIFIQDKFNDAGILIFKKGEIVSIPLELICGEDIVISNNRKWNLRLNNNGEYFLSYDFWSTNATYMCGHLWYKKDFEYYSEN